MKNESNYFNTAVIDSLQVQVNWPGCDSSQLSNFYQYNTIAQTDLDSDWAFYNFYNLTQSISVHHFNWFFFSFLFSKEYIILRIKHIGCTIAC